MKHLVLVSLLLTGCASSITQTDQGVYTVAKTGGPFSSAHSTRTVVYEMANEFCAGKGLAVETLRVDSRFGIPAFRPAGADLDFKCVPIKPVQTVSANAPE